MELLCTKIAFGDTNETCKWEMCSVLVIVAFTYITLFCEEWKCA